MNDALTELERFRKALFDICAQRCSCNAGRIAAAALETSRDLDGCLPGCTLPGGHQGSCGGFNMRFKL